MMEVRKEDPCELMDRSTAHQSHTVWRPLHLIGSQETQSSCLKWAPHMNVLFVTNVAVTSCILAAQNTLGHDCECCLEKYGLNDTNSSPWWNWWNWLQKWPKGYRSDSAPPPAVQCNVSGSGKHDMKGCTKLPFGSMAQNAYFSSVCVCV